MTVLKNGFVARKTTCTRMTGGADHSRNYRNWWLVKYRASGRDSGSVELGTVILPEQYVGKRVRFRVEVLE